MRFRLSVILLLALTMLSFVSRGQSFLLVDLRDQTFDSRQVCDKDEVIFGKFDNAIVSDSSRVLLQRSSESFSIISRADWNNELIGKKVLVVIHGMAKSWEEANKDLCNVYWNIGKHAISHYDVVVGVSWPGDDYLGISPFFKANRNSIKSGKVLGPILASIQESTSALDVITHSMGSKVASKMLKTEKVSFRNAFYLAPSIMRGSLKGFGRWSRTLKGVENRMLIFHSTGDWAFNWTTMQHMGMGYAGAKTSKSKRHAKIQQINCDEVVNQQVYRQIPRNAFTSRSNHSYYTQCNEVFNYLAQFLQHSPNGQTVVLPKI